MGKNMTDNNLFKKSLALAIIAIFCSLAIAPAIGTSNITGISLPPPLNVDMSLECAISRRMSVREFTDEPVTDEELSTVLWAAYGYREDKSRTVHAIDGIHSTVIYVLKEDAVYRYDPFNHSLVFHIGGDYRNIIGWQYEAPIQLGIAWDTSKTSNENYNGAEIGEIGQNIYFMANALGLGTVATGEVPSPIENISLPPNEIGKIVMPLGHPKEPYNFVYRPRWLSFLPRMKNSGVSLSTVLDEREETTSFGGILSRQEKSQVLWASYGYLYNLDKIDQENNPLKRHRTVPSAHGFYPLRIYAVTKRGIYRYIPDFQDYDRFGLPIVTFLMKIRMGDRRDDVADASQSFVSSAPFIIISVLDKRKTNQWDDLSAEELRWLWFYESGASAHNVLMEASAWDLTSNIVTISDPTAIRSLLRLNENFQPLFIVPVGK